VRALLSDPSYRRCGSSARRSTGRGRRHHGRLDWRSLPMGWAGRTWPGTAPCRSAPSRPRHWTLAALDPKNVYGICFASASTRRRCRTRCCGESKPLSAWVRTELGKAVLYARTAQIQTDRPGRTVRTRRAGVDSVAEDRVPRAGVAEIRGPADTAATAPPSTGARARERGRAVTETCPVPASLVRRTESSLGAGAAALAGQLAMLLAFGVLDAGAAGALRVTVAFGVGGFRGRGHLPLVKTERSGKSSAGESGEHAAARTDCPNRTREGIEPTVFHLRTPLYVAPNPS
jgi:hypothetical protein